MPTFTTHRQVAYTAHEMFELVADIECYPEFLPMCESLIIRSRKECEEKTLLLADMTVGYKMFRETFTTQVFLHPKENLIEVKYIDGPFKYLENRWVFHDLKNTNACDIEFFIDYEFKSKMLGLAVGSMFSIAFHKFTDAFEKRAHQIYGFSTV
ncbi:MULTISPECIES: type II toxin-antitoxin system RatA family toxin [unclassified Bartonella]|uniref:type II toxin-antitoxin system RatA family toxin n=1 Tax=Bartonella TaxID=773 RepID=UPI00099A1230|nr:MULTISPECIES: type II toxin-antitoxin system RatA family toxin [unclassified Bartonella]AQX18499.1 coenzyme Q-binding protein COQ10 [Bartonella sp. A1379B]AQX23012.1 coenzyme Q-binding protein COQ10 [Bartonella sp. 11B]AQX23691.1 coenzyme Q-binding protein COQ10 [Bartonella sp. 114]AQX25465.1 coenzyme Q-binding protein COQ10 [Bartonella sp. Coyote22sub2]